MISYNDKAKFIDKQWDGVWKPACKTTFLLIAVALENARNHPTDKFKTYFLK